MDIKRLNTVLTKDKEIEQFKNKNINRYFCIFNPKAFLDSKNIDLIEKNIKLGKISLFYFNLRE